MLIYIGVMLVMAFLTNRWCKNEHMVRPEYITYTGKITHMLHILCVGACISAACMLICFIWRMVTGEFLRILAVIAILIYGSSIMYSSIQIYLIQKEVKK